MEPRTSELNGSQRAERPPLVPGSWARKAGYTAHGHLGPRRLAGFFKREWIGFKKSELCTWSLHDP